MTFDKQKYQDLHKRFNQIFFDGKLPDAIIVTKEEAIADNQELPQGIDGAFAHDDETGLDYILIIADTMPAELVLLHEMIHQYCFLNGLEEDEMHGILFIEAAAAHGLVEALPTYNSNFEMFDGSRCNDFLECGIDLDTFGEKYVYYPAQSAEEYHGNLDWTKFMQTGDTAQ